MYRNWLGKSFFRRSNFFLLSTSSSTISLFCERAFCTSVFKLHRRCPSFFLEPLVFFTQLPKFCLFCGVGLVRQHFVFTLAGWRRGRTTPTRLGSKQPACTLPCNTNGMFVWHLRPFDLVHTFVSEQKRQHHSFRPSIVTALARSSSIPSCPAIHPLFFCVSHSSPLERSSAPTDWRKFDETAAANTTNNKTQRKSPESRSGHKNTQTPEEQKRLEQDFAPSLHVFATSDPFLGSSVSQMFTRHDSQSDAPCTRKVKSRLKKNETATIPSGPCP